jgi:hypothetical protein
MAMDEQKNEALPNKGLVTFLSKAKAFALASAKHVSAGARLASDEQISHRYSICLACEFLENNACNKCGCPVNRTKRYVSKLSWASESCPVGKWGPVTS